MGRRNRRRQRNSSPRQAGEQEAVHGNEVAKADTVAKADKVDGDKANRVGRANTVGRVAKGNKVVKANKVDGGGAKARGTGSGRYTPPTKRPFRFRPDWHKPLGWAIVVLGITIAVVNDLAFFDVRVMPGGHNELYLMLGVVVAGGGTWFLGAFDRSM